MKRWRRPRPLLLLALLLLAGAVVNVAVAWMLVGAPDAWTRGGIAMDYVSLASDRPEAAETLQLLAERARASSRSPRPREGWSWSGLGFSGVCVWDQNPFENEQGWAAARLDAGWPVRSMTSFQMAHAPAEEWSWSHFFSLEPPRALLPNNKWFPAYHDRIPLKPIPAGFALNTLFYTAILALPLSFFPIRRRLRARRGRCPKCGYDLAGLGAHPEGGAPCPECGATR